MPPTAEVSTPAKKVHKKKPLENHKIFYVEGMCETWPYSIPTDTNNTTNVKLIEFLGEQGVPGSLPPGLPKHVEWMRRYPLDFRKIIPAIDGDKSGVVQCVEDNCPHALNKAWRQGLSTDEASTWRRWLDELFQDHCEVARKATRLRKERNAENDWQPFLDGNIFRDPREYRPWHKYFTLRKNIVTALTLIDSNSPARGIVIWHGMQPIYPADRTKAKFRDFSVRGLPWKASNVFRDLDSQFEWPSKPEPDIAFGFRIWEGCESIFQGREIGPAKKNFSFAVLQRLSTWETLHAMPLVLSTEKKAESSNHLLGFPFAVVEIKPDKASTSEQTTCLCQAANSASTSLKIQEVLWDKAGDRGRRPPVISFTCIGAKITVWLAFIIIGKDETIGNVMIPIWKGDVTDVWNVIQVRRIYENTLRWSLDHLRPQVSEAMTLIRDDLEDTDQGNESDESRGSSCEGKSEESGISKTTTSKKTPKRQTAPRSKTTPNTVQPIKIGHLEVTPTSGRRARSVEPKIPCKHALDSQPAQTNSTTRTRASSNHGTLKKLPSSRQLTAQFSKLSIGKGEI